MDNKISVTSPNNSQKPVEKIDVNALMQRLEKEGETNIINAYNTNNDVCKIAIQTMENGSKEFFAKTGRQMTYSEMRSMYG